MFGNTTNMVSTKNFLVTLALGSGSLFFAMNAFAAGEIIKTSDGSAVQTTTFYAGQTIDAGNVSFEVVGDDLVISYLPEGGWDLVETHLWIGDDLANMPQTRQGNPKIGNFPYTQNPVQIPLNVLGFSCPSADKNFYVAAHAAVQLTDGSGNVTQTETAWSDGDRFVQKGMWGTFTTITLSCVIEEEPTPPTAGNCETAFAYSGGTNAADGDITTSFLDIDENNDGNGDFNRWGWSNGAVGPGTYTWDIYAGAGQSNISKGTLVGTLTVDYDGSKANVSYDIDAPYSMDETHLYVGNEILPRDVNNQFTVAPGQYPTIHGDLNGITTDAYVVNNLSGDVHVVAHAVVCGF